MSVPSIIVIALGAVVVVVVVGVVEVKVIIDGKRGRGSEPQSH